MAAEIDTKRLGRIRRKLRAWFDRHKRDMPWRRTRDPYAVWLSEMMLQQTQVTTVIPYYERFLSRFPTVHDLASASPDEVLRVWAGLGYYARARHLHHTAQVVASEFGGRFPRTVAELRKLPGIGPYSAAAVASICFDVRAASVDGNVVRVVARLFNVSSDVHERAGRRTVEQLADRLLPRSRCGDFNQALMELGATVCLPGEAATCLVCPLRADCGAMAAGTVGDLPAKARRPTVKSETHVVAAIARDDRWLFVPRPARGLWGGLWEMPTAVLNGQATAALAARIARHAAGLACDVAPEPFCDLRHQLTHRTIRLIGHICRPKRRRRIARRGATAASAVLSPSDSAVSAVPSDDTTFPCEALLTEQWHSAAHWRALDDLDSLGMSKAMRKVVAALRQSS
ncbi:MAG: A/G-specific adenine glycosylase [Phycisphaerae bacterium]|nr:A/G-specific adenine glycosylase [Phycisphaerae bacterium]